MCRWRKWRGILAIHQCDKELVIEKVKILVKNQLRGNVHRLNKARSLGAVVLQPLSCKQKTRKFDF